jgi:hypothetical protein
MRGRFFWAIEGEGEGGRRAAGRGPLSLTHPPPLASATHRSPSSPDRTSRGLVGPGLGAEPGDASAGGVVMWGLALRFGAGAACERVVRCWDGGSALDGAWRRARRGG